MVRTRMDALLAESKAEGKAEGHRENLLALLASTKLTPQERELCRRGLERMTLEQMPDFGEVLKVILLSEDDLSALVLMCQPPELSDPDDAGNIL